MNSSIDVYDYINSQVSYVSECPLWDPNLKEDSPFLPFLVFEARFNSLVRHWRLSKKYISAHLEALKEVDTDRYRIAFERDVAHYRETYAELNEAERAEAVDPDDVFFDAAQFDYAFDVIAQDGEYFPEYLRLSTISCALALVENCLGGLGQEMSKRGGIEIDLDQRKLPFINKYILWLARGCGFELSIDSSLWKHLDAIREMRNRFIHRIDRDIPEQIKTVINEMVSGSLDATEPIMDEFVDTSLRDLAKLVKCIETAYEHYLNTHAL